MKNKRQRGDVMQVVRMTEAHKLKGGKSGYSFRYVLDVLKESRTNDAIMAMYDEVVALRTPTKRNRRK